MIFFKTKIFCVVSLAAIGLMALTWADLQIPPERLVDILGKNHLQRVYSSTGTRLNASWKDAFNTTHLLQLHEIPKELQEMLIFSEDKDFFHHGGVDWLARGAAVFQNLKHGRVLRGASTITEQVVRMIHPRSRNLWSKYMETIEAYLLESKASKGEILEFYFNQVPYASNKRGLEQASQHYFYRSLKTLNLKEMAALAVMVRSPSRWDLYKQPPTIHKSIHDLLSRMKLAGILEKPLESIVKLPLELQRSPAQPKPLAFLEYVRSREKESKNLTTTLDETLQWKVERLLTERVKALEDRKVHNGAALVVDHQSGHILAYAVAGNRDLSNPGSFIDAIQIPRQPGSTLKPFLYALALENGYSAAHVIEDSPLDEAVGTGLHEFNNYSNSYYGPVTIRQALANSLNIPAIRMINSLGVGAFYALLKDLQIQSLTKSADFYGKGLALGNGEISLFELVRAYTALANRGKIKELVYNSDIRVSPERKIFSEEASSLIGNILSDSVARSLEFGQSKMFDFPIQTAVKTGTSTDYRDAWTMAYNDKYIVGIWMGNLNQQPMNQVTGSFGPAILARAIMNEVTRGKEIPGLYFSKNLQAQTICPRERNFNQGCENLQTMTEWFFDIKTSIKSITSKKVDRDYKVGFPTSGLIVAVDPRLPRSEQEMKFRLENTKESDQVVWLLNGASVNPLWRIYPGEFQLMAQVIREGQVSWQSPSISFTVVE